MANYVMNRIHFDTDEDTAREIFAAIQKDANGNDSETKRKSGPDTIDFNKLIPEPQEFLKTGKWEDWRIKNWGTKWDAFGEKSDGISTISFLTAWDVPHNILEALSCRFPGVYFTHIWANDDIGSNVGQREYLNGECVGVVEPESDMECIDVACSVWGAEPMDCGYVLNQTGTGYCQVDSEELDVIEFLDRTMLFSNDRLFPDELPIGLYAYELRMTDDGERYGSLEPSVGVNFGGTVLTDQPIDFGEAGYLELTEDNDPNFTGETRTMGQFLRDEWEDELGEDFTETGGMTLE